jgi:DNA modification methylase
VKNALIKDPIREAIRPRTDPPADSPIFVISQDNFAVVRTQDLQPDPDSLRLHTQHKKKRLARYIKNVGFIVPIIIDSQSKIIAGNVTFDAARKLGLPKLPVIRVNHLTPAQIEMFKIAHNRFAEDAKWDDHGLALKLNTLSLGSPDLDLELTGFSWGEIDVRIEGLSVHSDDDQADLAAASDPEVTQMGDIWIAGRHRICCGNALESKVFKALLQSEQADMVFTDPPYNVRIDGHAIGNGRIRHREFGMASGEMSVEAFIAFLKTFLGLAAIHSRDGSLHYIFMDWRHLPELFAAGNDIYTELKNLCVWNKDGAGMGSFYRSQHEIIGVFKHGTAPHRNNIELGKNGRHRTNVWSYPGIRNFRHGEEGDLLAMHPTVKPVSLVADAILDCTARGDLVLDPFLGSGTTLIAAERVGRRCYAIELDPLYVDTAIRRWQRMTGEVAYNQATGRPFGESEPPSAAEPLGRSHE